MFSTTFALICCRHGLIIKKTLVQFYHGTEQDQSTTTETRKDAEAGLNIAKASTHTVLKCLTDGCKKVSLRVELNITISSSYWDYTIKGDFSKFRKFANSCAQGHTDKYMYE